MRSYDCRDKAYPPQAGYSGYPSGGAMHVATRTDRTPSSAMPRLEVVTPVSQSMMGAAAS